MPRPRAILLDLFGTLVDDETEHKALDAVMERVAKRFALDAKADELSGEFGLALMEILHGEGPAGEDNEEEPAEFLPFREAASGVFAGLLEFRGFQATPEDEAWFWDAYLEEHRRRVRATAEAKPALEKVRGLDLHVGILTDADRELAQTLLKALRIEDLVDSVTCAEDSGHVKPSPLAFQPALERAGVGPDEAVMVGHSYERDVLGARAAGIERGILIDRHKARMVDIPMLSSMKRVPKLLAKEIEEPEGDQLRPESQL